jgi:hypothetical protein
MLSVGKSEQKIGSSGRTLRSIASIFASTDGKTLISVAEAKFHFPSAVGKRKPTFTLEEPAENIRMDL